MASAKETITKLTSEADIQVNGTRPWDITVHDERFYNRVLSGGSLALGESYMDGWWDAGAVDEFISRVLKHNMQNAVKPTLGLLLSSIKARFLNLQSPSRAFEVGEKHYDLGNDLYEAMLDKRMVYTCGYWSGVDSTGSPKAVTLDEAQEAKLDLVCRKIGLKKGDRILDIGCGWGSFAKFAAERYGASVVGITVSVEQAALARELSEGLSIEIRIQDYRDVNEKFDHVISLGMFEHVGYKNFREYFKMARRCLKTDGLLLLHTIGGNVLQHQGDPWSENIYSLMGWCRLSRKLEKRARDFSLLKIGITSAHTMTKRSWLGSRILKPTGQKLARNTVTDFTECGSIIFSHSPGRSVPAISIYGR